MAPKPVASGLTREPPKPRPLPVSTPFHWLARRLYWPNIKPTSRPPDADVAGGHVGVGADMAEELGHEALAEAHDLVLALAVGIEVRSALAAAHRQAGERVLEDLLEAEELERRERDLRVEADTALVGADRRVELDTIAAIDMVGALVVHPGHAEHHGTLRLGDALEDSLGLVLGLGVDEGRDGLKDFLDRLEEFRLPGIPGPELVEDLLDVGVHGKNCKPKPAERQDRRRIQTRA